MTTPRTDTTPVDVGPLDWRIGITDKAGRPTPEFQRRWNLQRNNNTFIGGLAIGEGAPTGVPVDGQGYVDISAHPPTLYIGSAGDWVIVGVLDFTDLKDVPHSYTGAALELVQVNSAATGLQFSQLSAILDALGTTQGSIIYRSATGWVILVPGTAGQILTTEGTGQNPKWATPASGGVLPLVNGDTIPVGIITTPDGQTIGVPL